MYIHCSCVRVDARIISARATRTLHRSGSRSCRPVCSERTCTHPRTQVRTHTLTLSQRTSCARNISLILFFIKYFISKKTHSYGFPQIWISTGVWIMFHSNIWLFNLSAWFKIFSIRRTIEVIYFIFFKRMWIYSLFII